jgi:uncharacterized tellurite resistance protein B-like protein
MVVFNCEKKDGTDSLYSIRAKRNIIEDGFISDTTDANELISIVNNLKNEVYERVKLNIQISYENKISPLDAMAWIKTYSR